MSAPSMLFHFILERFSRFELARVPEPNLLMDGPEQISVFIESGREEGNQPFTYFFHALQATSVVRPACGPANQLVQIARLNPNAHFVGLDASANMLDRARATLARCGVGNVSLIPGDMTRLTDIDDAAFDCVMCTMSLRHLPDLTALGSTMREVRRALNTGGGLYLADFGRLKRPRAQHFLRRIGTTVSRRNLPRIISVR
jgi:ubiquinone/menaquinone biosynthesis C-methylase UbiE